tara:strand:- start:1122 stop:1760 length:639 start_codon:yes stop_codon:yes gene_type:complete
MARILITSGPTRQYLDPVRYLTNGSSGRMGVALTQACLDLQHQVVVVSGPVEVEYPAAAEVVSVISTDEMLDVCCRIFPDCDGVIGAAAPCDYRPVQVKNNKIVKNGEPLQLHLVETPDVVATLGARKQHQWLVGFALETEDHRFRAIVKLERKSCDLIVLNEPAAMNSDENRVEVLAPEGKVGETISGSKRLVARGILKVIQKRLVECDRS